MLKRNNHSALRRARRSTAKSNCKKVRSQEVATKWKPQQKTNVVFYDIRSLALGNSRVTTYNIHIARLVYFRHMTNTNSKGLLLTETNLQVQLYQQPWCILRNPLEQPTTYYNRLQSTRSDSSYFQEPTRTHYICCDAACSSIAGCSRTTHPCNALHTAALHYQSPLKIRQIPIRIGDSRLDMIHWLYLFWNNESATAPLSSSESIYAYSGFFVIVT